MEASHTTFGLNSVGLCLNPTYGYFGATPDGLVECSCCEMGCVEVKCPFCARDIGLEDINILKKVGLGGDDKELSENHPYYYQIQMQLALTGLGYCDFVVWSFFQEGDFARNVGEVFYKRNGYHLRS